MDNGHNQLGGVNQEVFQGNAPDNNPFMPTPDLRATGNKILNFNPENTPVEAEAAPQIGGEMPQMGEIVDVSPAPENIPGMITSYNIRTDKDKGLNEDGRRAIADADRELEASKDPSDYYNKIREFTAMNVNSLGGHMGKAA